MRAGPGGTREAMLARRPGRGRRGLPVSGTQRARQAGAEQRDRPPGGSGPPSWAAAALLDSLHEGFFVCDEAGSVVQINAAFTQILGFGPDGLPYPVEHPWWPPADTDPDGHRQVTEAVDRLRRDGGGRCTAPARHRDGHKLWLSASVGEVRDPVTGHRAVVGTIRDVTAEHDAGQRDATVALQRDLPGPARSPAGVAPPGCYDDDVALVAYRHPGPLNLAFPAEPTQLAPIRAALRGWLSRCGVGHRAVHDILVAAGEACANAIEHGHRNTAGQHIRLRAEATVSRLRLTITDAGRWKGPSRRPARSAGAASRSCGPSWSR